MAAYGNTIELTGDTASGKKLASKYKLSQSENQIAYYRMYNFTIANAPARADGVGNEPSYSMGNATILSSGEDGGVASSISKLVTEWELQGMPSKSEIKQRQKQISLPSRDDLTIDEAYSVALIGSGLSVNSQASAFDTARIIMVFIGLVVVSYAVLLFVAMIFDRVNVFIDISLVSILTFGKLKYSPYEEDSINKKGFVTTKKLVIQLIVVLLVGIFILSSCVFTILGDVVYWISSKL